ncbi:MAG: divergent polysaccharide deacetylase family protein, partial [Pseudomonadales bacterium]|nr:divergent polysaccharide deacetylase family protein [Pseudomonadales bacterium]
MNTGVTSHRIVLLLALTLASLNAPADEPTAYISIIIDDKGYSLYRGEQAIAIPAHLTYAILPNSTHAKSLAKKAFVAGKEIMVHLPIENTAQIPMVRCALTSAQPKDNFLRAIYQSLDRVP